MKKICKRVCTGILALTTILTALPITSVQAAETQYWTESSERVGYIEHVMNDGTIHSTFNEGHMRVEGETAYCVDINTGFKNGYKTRHDASASMSAAQIEDVALSLEYVKQYRGSHSNLNANQGYLLEQCVVWQRLSEQLGWKCDNVRAAYSEISQDIQNEVYAGARAFVQANKGRYKCGGYIYTGEGQDLGQFWAELNVGNAKVKKTTANEIVTNGNAMYSIVGATFGIFLDQNCSNQIGTLTTNENGDTNEVEVTAGTVYIKELSAPKGYKLDTTVRSLKVEAGKTAVLNVSDVPKVTETLVDLFKIDMETGKATAQGNAALAGAEFTWHYYDGLYTKDNLPEKATRTWVTKTVAEKDSDGTIHYVTKLADAYKVSGDAFYTQNEKSVLPLGTLTVEETKAPNGYLLDGAYMQAGDSTEQIKGMYLTQITEDGELAVLSGRNQYSVSDQVIRGGVKIQKRDLETKDTKAQGSATLKDTAFAIISLNENPVLVEGKLYKKNETVKMIQTGIDGIATTTADLLPYGKYKMEETKAPEGYLTDGAKAIEFSITENGKIVDLTDESHSIYNQIKRGDLEGVKIGAGTHKRLANVPFKITSKTTGESHIVVTDKNGQFSTASDWASHKKNTNAGKSTLLNRLTGAGILAEDKLFATLDPTTRLLNLKDGQQILLTDTVGFIHKLPHHLVEAFKSTLEEAKYADYIIHVVDSSNQQAEMQMHVVYETLKELGVMGKKIITLFNKQDAPGACVLRDFKSDYTLKVSAKTGEGLADLNDLLKKLLAEEQIYVERLFPYQEAGKIQLIREYGQLISEEYTEEGIAVKARVPKEIYARVV